MNTPFSDLVQLSYPFLDSIAQWLEEVSSIHPFPEFPHPTSISKSKSHEL